MDYISKSTPEEITESRRARPRGSSGKWDKLRDEIVMNAPVTINAQAMWPGVSAHSLQPRVKGILAAKKTANLFDVRSIGDGKFVIDWKSNRGQTGSPRMTDTPRTQFSHTGNGRLVGT